MAFLSSSYIADMGCTQSSVTQTHGPWGTMGRREFDDGVYTGVRQIKLTREVGVTSIKVLYDRHGQEFWGKQRGMGDIDTSPDKIVFDFPSEVLTHITGYYGPTIFMGPMAVRSLTFHTNRRMHGPFGKECGIYFSSSFADGRIMGFHGREGLYIGSIGVHVPYGKVASSLRASRNTLPSSSPPPRVDLSKVDEEVPCATLVKEPVAAGPGVTPVSGL